MPLGFKGSLLKNPLELKNLNRRSYYDNKTFTANFLLVLSFQAFSETKKDMPKLEEDRFVKSEQRDHLSQDEIFKTIPQDRYFAGAAAGAFLGFGIGHAIQGRWKERGWIFTAGEIVSIAVALYFYEQGKKEVLFLSSSPLYLDSYGISTGGPFVSGSIPFVLSLAAFMGFQIWEKIDIFLLPSHYKTVKESPFQIKPLAFYDKRFHYGLSLNYQF